MRPRDRFVLVVAMTITDRRFAVAVLHVGPDAGGRVQEDAWVRVLGADDAGRDDTEVEDYSGMIVEHFAATPSKLALPPLELLMGEEVVFTALVICGAHVSEAMDENAEWFRKTAELIECVVSGVQSVETDERLQTSSGTGSARIVATGIGALIVTFALEGGRIASEDKACFGSIDLKPKPLAPLLGWYELPGTSNLTLAVACRTRIEALPNSALALLVSSDHSEEEEVVEAFIVPGAEVGVVVLAMLVMPELDESDFLEHVFPLMTDSGLMNGAQLSATLERLYATPLDTFRCHTMLRAFIKREVISNEEEDAQVLLAQLRALREGFEHSVLPQLTQGQPGSNHFFKNTTNVHNKVSKEAAALEAMWTKADLQRHELAEALLRGEGTASEVCAVGFAPKFPGGGNVAPLIASAKHFWADTSQEASATLASVHKANILCACVVRCGDTVAVISGGADKLVGVTDLRVEGGSPLCHAKGKSPVTAIKALPTRSGDISTILVACMDGQAQLARLSTNGAAGLSIEMSSTGIKKHTKLVTCVAWSPCGRFFATTSRDNAVHIYSFQNDDDEQVRLLQAINCNGSPEAVEFVECYGCICIAVAVRDDYCLQYVCVDSSAGTDARLAPGEAYRVNMNAKGDTYVSFAVLALAAAPKNLPIIAACTDKSRVIIFRSGAPQQYRNLYGLTSGDYARPAIAWDPTGRFLAANSEADLAVHVWHVPTGDHVLVLSGHRQSVRDLAFYDAGEEHQNDDLHGVLVSSSFDKTIKVWKQLAKTSV